ncbi:MAG TPA: hypothetical protein VFO68_22850, partial [Actinophytocola sp.]
EEPPPANPTGPGTTTGDRPSTGGDSPAGRAPSGDGAARPDRQPAAPDARDRDEDPALAAGAGSDDLSGAGTAVAESPPQLNVAAPDSVAAEPLASSVEPVSDDGPIGLLAVIAIVCVLGVSAGAIRAILSQRAYRSSFAVN